MTIVLCYHFSLSTLLTIYLKRTYEYELIRQSIYVGIGVLFTTIAIAESCPTIDEVKNNNLHGWGVVKNDVYTPASEEEIATFQNQAAEFIEVTWLAEGQHGGTAFCEYAPVYKTAHIFVGRFEVGNYDQPDPGNLS